MKDFKLIERCMDILYYPFKMGLLDISNMPKDRDPEFIKICRIVYFKIKNLKNLGIFYIYGFLNYGNLENLKHRTTYLD